MRKKIILLSVVMLFFGSFQLFSASIDEIKAKLGRVNNIKSDSGVKKYSKGKRLKIVSAKFKMMNNVVWKGNITKNKFTNKVYAVQVNFKIKRLSRKEKVYTPEIMKVYLYDKHKKLIGTIGRYLIREGSGYTENKRVFAVNRSYSVFFITDFVAYKNTKTYIVVIGTPKEEIVAKLGGRGKIEDFEFGEKELLMKSAD